MVLYLLKNKKNKKRLQMNITELTAVSEMVLIIGLFMLTIGTFLGGVWANESWGRYWGWDPKETWALVSILVYAIIIHFRFIPALSSKFLFNVLTLWGYSAILFTFFGVNFVLVGLHSYAQGDGVAETPTSVIIAVGAFALFTLLATVKYLLDSSKKSKK
jgi:ABC-type transport system involved in cytochrome c biogenesis permease subunit